MKLTNFNFDIAVPDDNLFQRLRLILSTFQDGTGQLHSGSQQTLPDWRDFERSIAVAFNGEAQEDKSLFDVLVPLDVQSQAYIGISCKMRKTLSETRKGYVSLKLSNSAGQFWDAIHSVGLNQQTYRMEPELVGKAILTRVADWHQKAASLNGKNILQHKSFFLVLSWDQKTRLYQFHHELPNPEKLTWEFPDKLLSGRSEPGRRLVGLQNDQRIMEWYGESGGQLKYYPCVESALWYSPQFTLEPIPTTSDIKNALVSKVNHYFEAQWAQVTNVPF